MKRMTVLAFVFLAMVITQTARAESTLTATVGYEVASLLTVNGDAGAYSAGIHAFDRDVAGDLYIFSANQIIKNPAGAAQVLFNYQTAATIYGSFVKVWGDTVYFGESSLGTVRSVSTTGGDAVRLFTIPDFRQIPARMRRGLDFNLSGNFACAFNSQSEMFLSANPGGWVGENKVYYWDSQTAPVVVADLGGYSGPIAFDRNDNLYYGFTNFPAGPEDIVCFTASQLAGAIASGTPLGSSDWTVVTEVDACSGFAFDEDSSPNLYSTSSLGTITRIGNSSETSIFGTGSSPSQLSFTAGTGEFLPFQPDGSQLWVLCTDWLDYSSTLFSIEAGEWNFTAVFRPSSGLWALRGITRTYFGRDGDAPSPADFDGDGLEDIALFRESSGLWAVRGITRAYFGRGGDKPSPADFSGDGTGDLALFRPSSGLWAVRGVTRAYFGREGDVPASADFDGNGTDNIAIFRGSTGLWAVRGLTRAYFGREGDQPSPADFDGDGTGDLALFRPSSGLWAVRGVTRTYFGRQRDVPVPADFNHNGKTDFAVFRPSNGLWAVRGLTRFYFGGESDIPLSR